MRWFCLGSAAWLLIAGALAGADKAPKKAQLLTLRARRQKSIEGPRQRRQFQLVEETVEWDPRQTALIVCDMWDDHWCQGAARRVAELAGPLNRVVDEARRQGVFIIHAPSTTVDFYADLPQRKRAQAAPLAKTPVPLASDMRWGTCWCWPDKDREPDLPIDDSDMGCDCREKCEIRAPWTRQIASIDIDEADAISDNGQEVFNLLRQRGTKHVIMTGVHLNMCVLGRPFAIRQLVRLGFDVVLVRDMTDTMYNSQKKPFVDHFTGTDLVVEHVEKYWCPTIASVDLVGGAPFRFKEDKRPNSNYSSAP
ncbi:MAG TPA: cysteine hydrolase family protein [Pirellulales bacterium]|jgi:nicotinamidase-related amidase|nr:cysteine hydrolase family protein [Pirellulales bacterium]